jgi:hypothetical protein
MDTGPLTADFHRGKQLTYWQMCAWPCSRKRLLARSKFSVDEPTGIDFESDTPGDG